MKHPLTDVLRHRSIQTSSTAYSNVQHPRLFAHLIFPLPLETYVQGNLNFPGNKECSSSLAKTQV